ncbi:hypothetical protein F5B22DRAFT_608522 [Xylaria bambusicola]|uniref:uncharacterized protein n=1 Tax=Xylaria bambusicola TaxID=326684 RepID=UPI0020084A37|nr:uncharacterized protein F5B22DRAFT_608522 [Xylaria bambusicola]KAI0515142.1 hypothetical protein F5B22DRAFT_608522 [Xylaria bambusicola]
MPCQRATLLVLHTIEVAKSHFTNETPARTEKAACCYALLFQIGVLSSLAWCKLCTRCSNYNTMESQLGGPMNQVGAPCQISVSRLCLYLF